MNKRRILIVEDETITAMDLEKILKSNGYEVIGTVDNGKAAIETAKTEKPDMVLMDVRLNGRMDGIEAAATLKREWSIPVVFLTAFGEEETIERASEVMPYGYLIKPVDEKNLRLTLRMALNLLSAEKQRQEAERQLQITYNTLQTKTEELTDSRQQYMELVETANSIVLKLDAQGCVTFFNHYAQDFFGYTESEIIGKHAIDAIVPDRDDSGRPLKPMIRDILQQPEKFAVNENENIRKNGDRVWVSWSNKGIQDEAGNLVELLSIGHDITARKQLEKELISNQRKLDAAHEMSRIGHWELDIRNNKLYWSNEIFRLFEVDSQKFEPTYERFLAGIHPEDRELVDTAYQQSLETKTPYDLIHRLQWKDGTIRHVREICRTEYNEAGEPIRSLGTVQDVTEQVQVQEALQRAKEEADSANRAKSRFLANMSHELRTPLNGIIGFTQVLENQLADQLNAKQLEYFNYIKEGGQHLLEMVNDILDLSKIEAGRTDLEVKPFDFTSMLQRAPALVASQASQKNLEIELNIPPDLGWLHGDETRLKQVLFNLLSNAVKFTEPGRRIGIDAKGIEQTAEVVVWDEGIGIPTDKTEAIFKPFEQLKSSQTATNPGTGLGLSISRRLVELHGGKLTAGGRDSGGSRFTIQLPGRIPDTAPHDNQTPENREQMGAGMLSGYRILVTEDNLSNQTLIDAALEPEGCALDFAETGEDAVAMAAVGGYHLILMDIQLPGIDGVEAMRRIRANTTEAMPIIALTAFAMKGDEEHYLATGFDAYLSKPLNLDMLTQTVYKALGIGGD